MANNYFSFLDYRTTQRQLFAKFARPRALMLHVFAFIATITFIFAYGIATELWFYSSNFMLPTLIGGCWSLLLAAHAFLHYRRSAAVAERREIAVDEAMQQYIEKHGDNVDHDALFAMHQELESKLEQQGRWSLALTAFALVNTISWLVSALSDGTAWPFQMTLPFAVITVSGVHLFLNWQQRRVAGVKSWFVRLPLRHIAAYAAGVIALGLAGGYRLINHWDADTLIKGWSLVVLLHIVGAVLVWPLIAPFLAATDAAQAPVKRKVGSRLALADDGEVLHLDDDDSQQLQSSRF